MTRIGTPAKGRSAPTRRWLRTGAAALLVLSLTTPAKAEPPDAPAPLPPPSPETSPAGPDRCAGAASLAIVPDVGTELTPARDAATDWDDAVQRCPSPATLYRMAAAHELVARQEHSVLHLQQAVASYQKALAAGPSAGERPIVETRLTETRGLLGAWRARPMLQEAREAAARDDGERAIPLYDQYLKEATGDPERAVVEQERARFVARYRGDQGRDARGRYLTGGLLIAGGLAAAGGGGALVAVSLSKAQDAKTAVDVAQHDARLQNATYMEVGGIALVGIGTAAVIGGIVRLAMGKSELPHAVWVAPAPGGLVAGGRF